MANREDVARLANVSVATVTNVLTGRKPVGKDLSARVYDAASKLHYIPDASAQRLASGINKHIGVAVSELANPYHIEIIRGIESYASEKGYAVSMFDLDNNDSHKFRLIAARRLGGVVDFMTDEYPKEYIKYFVQDGVVMVNFDYEQGFRIDTVYTEGMTEMVRKVASLGHKRAAFISSFATKYMFSDERASVLRDMRAECGFDIDDGLFAGYDGEGKKISEDIGYMLTRKLLADGKKFTVLFCLNDMMALGALTALRENGLRVPEDVSVVGCDDIAICKYMNPPLTTMGFDKFAHGRNIAKTIIDKIENPDLPYTVQTTAVTPIYRQSLGSAKIL